MDLVSLRGPAVPAASRARPPPPPLPPHTEAAGAPAISKAMSEADAAALSEWDELGKVNMFPSARCMIPGACSSWVVQAEVSSTACRGESEVRCVNLSFV